MKRIFVKEQVCMGCRLCEVYCTVHHSKSRDAIKAYRREYPRPISRVKVEETKPLSFAVQCRNCEDSPCVVACLTGAMRFDEETGLVMHYPEKCMGCWTCIMVCPYDAVRIDRERKVVAKCDFCRDLDVPVCVANCPNEALTYEEVTL